MSYERAGFDEPSIEHLEHEYQIDIADNFNTLFKHTNIYEKGFAPELENPDQWSKTSSIIGVYTSNSEDPSEGKPIVNKNSQLILKRTPTQDNGYFEHEIILCGNKDDLQKSVIGHISYVYDAKHDDVLLYNESTLGDLVIDWRDLLRMTDKALTAHIKVKYS